MEFITLALKHQHLSEDVPLVYANVLEIQIEHFMRSWELLLLGSPDGRAI